MRFAILALAACVILTGCGDGNAAPAADGKPPVLGACRILTPQDVAKPANATKAVACAEKHTAETFAVGDLPDEFEDADYGDAKLGAWAYRTCTKGFKTFLGADESLVMRGGWTIDGGRRLTEALLERPDPPTAIFAFNDRIAVGAYDAARLKGLNIPGDLSVVGVDDHELAGFFGLSTVAQYPAEQGRRAVEMLMDRLHPTHRTPAENVPLRFDLIERASTAAPRTPPRAG